MPDERNVTHGVLFALYFVNATLLICHEIDSAFWREWELFRLPGGAAGFVALHFALVPLILWGLVLLARRARAARWLSLLVALGGLAGGVAHGVFLGGGDARFVTLFSTGLIVAFGAVSALQGALTLVWWRRGFHDHIGAEAPRAAAGALRTR